MLRISEEERRRKIKIPKRRERDLSRVLSRPVESVSNISFWNPIQPRTTTSSLNENLKKQAMPTKFFVMRSFAPRRNGAEPINGQKKSVSTSLVPHDSVQTFVQYCAMRVAKTTGPVMEPLRQALSARTGVVDNFTAVGAAGENSSPLRAIHAPSVQVRACWLRKVRVRLCSAPDPRLSFAPSRKRCGVNDPKTTARNK